MGSCCCLPSFRTKADGSPIASLSRCRDRLCPLCADRRGGQATNRTCAVVERFNAPRFITLTLKHKDATLECELARLHVALKKLRADKAWAKRVVGGVYGVEVTRNTKQRQWHVHVHLIVDGEYFPHEVLKAVWLACTGDSFIVEVQMVKDRRKTARYISRYVSKPVDLESWSAEEVREYAAAMHGRRLLQTFGAAHNVKIDDDEEPAEDPGTKHLCSAMKLFTAVRSGSKHAAEAARILAAVNRDLSFATGTHWLPSPDAKHPTADQVKYAVRVLAAIEAVLADAPDDDAIQALLEDVEGPDPHAAASIQYVIPEPPLQ